MGFLPATSGRVQFAECDVTALVPYRRARLGLGYVPQGREIFPGLTTSRPKASKPSIIDEIVETLERRRDRSGLALILVEQNLDFIAALSQRILVIRKGRITEEVLPDDLPNASRVGEFVGITTLIKRATTPGQAM